MTDKLLIERELLERELLSVLDFSESNLRRVVDHLIDVGYTRAAPRQPEGDYSVTPNLQDVTVVGYAAQQDLDWHGDCTLRKTAMLDYDTPLCRLSDAKRAIAELRAEISDLHTTMMAAAVEIQEHWQAHCDEEGYGPANLMHRLERGIASQYGYTAQTLVQIEAERDTLRQQRDKLLERQPDSFKHGYAFAREANQAQHGIRLQRECDTLRQQLAEQDAEIMEQCRLNGMGAERELKLLTQRDKLAGLLREVRVIVALEVERWTRAAAILPVNANVASGLLTRIDAALAKLEGTQCKPGAT